MRFTKRQRENIAKIFINLGTLVFGAIVLGYFVTENPISLTEFVVGAIVSFLCFYWAIKIDKGE